MQIWKLLFYAQNTMCFVTITFTNHWSFLSMVHKKFDHYHSMAQLLITLHEYSSPAYLPNWQSSPKVEKMHIKYKFYNLLQIFRNLYIMGSVEVNKEFCITLSTFQRRLNPTFTTETKILYSLYNLLKDLHCRNQSLSFCVSYKPMLY